MFCKHYVHILIYKDLLNKLIGLEEGKQRKSWDKHQHRCQVTVLLMCGVPAVCSVHCGVQLMQKGKK